MTAPLRSRSSRRLAALVCLGLFLTLDLFASSNALHKLIHPDADSPGHHCAVTLLTHGRVNLSAATAPSAGIAGVLRLAPQPLISAVFPAAAFRLFPSRAPPLV